MNNTEFKKYPIYSFSIKVKDGINFSLQEQWIENRNMFKHELSKEELDNEIKKCIEGILARKKWTIIDESKTSLGKYIEMSAKEAGLKVIDQKIGDVCYDSWVIEWFSHKTIDEGQDDKYFLDSFEEFVSRKEDEIAKSRENPTYCLMGAEDRWRWSGMIYPENWNKSQGFDKIQRDAPPPCRCKYCKEQGVVRINH
jgi:hypothetical protein